MSGTIWWGLTWIAPGYGGGNYLERVLPGRAGVKWTADASKRLRMTRAAAERVARKWNLGGGDTWRKYVRVVRIGAKRAAPRKRKAGQR